MFGKYKKYFCSEPHWGYNNDKEKQNKLKKNKNEKKRHIMTNVSKWLTVAITFIIIINDQNKWLGQIK